MPKYQTLSEYIQSLNHDAKKMYETIKSFMMSLDDDIQERLFAGQVAYYKEATLKHTFHASPVLVLAFQKDHVNIFANANERYQKHLKMYTMTKKFTLQIKYDQKLESILKDVFIESLK